jgi:hypothetical protein
MALGTLESEGDLNRWLQQRLATPGVLPPPKADVSLTIEKGEPSDEDFPQPPADRTLVYSRETGTLYIRDEGEWKPV